MMPKVEGSVKSSRSLLATHRYSGLAATPATRNSTGSPSGRTTWSMSPGWAS